ncbi:MAG: hypothetical protein WBB00_29180 [Mycobacterium sp.]
MDRYRDKDGNEYTEEEMQNLFSEDLADLDSEQREEITFEDWVSESWGGYSLIDDEDEASS